MSQLSEGTIDSTMRLRQNWDDEKLLIKFLANHLVNGRLALILGSGLSQPFGLPGWKQLVLNLYKNENKEINIKDNDNLLSIMDEFRIDYYKNDVLGYYEAIQKSLYPEKKITFKALHKNLTLSAIASLVVSSQRGKVSNIITLNYDNLLEIYLSYLGFTVSPIYKEKFWKLNSDILVFHPHGYLPYGEKIPAGVKVILDKKSYNEVLGDKANLWNENISTIFRSHFCLFVGFSGEDPDYDVQIHKANENHIIKEQGVPFWAVKVIKKIKRTADEDEKRQRERQQKIDNSYGIFNIEVKDWKTDLPEKLFLICQEAANIRKSL